MKEGSCENSQSTTAMIILTGADESIKIKDTKNVFLAMHKNDLKVSKHKNICKYPKNVFLNICPREICTQSSTTANQPMTI